ncbi:putative ribonuclease H-like domain-containing protein, partial [Tanacetum coccineum]
SQIPDKSRKGLGFASYNAVPPPHTGLFAPPTLDLSNSSLEEFQQPEFEGYGPKISKSIIENVSNKVRKSPDALLVEELVSDVDKFEKKTVFPTKIEFVKQQEKPNRKPVKPKAVNTARPNTAVVNAVRANQGHPQQEDQGYVDSGCSRHMTRNMSYLSDFKEFDGGYVTFGGGAKGGRITGKGTLKTGKLDFEDVYFFKELQINLFSVSQMCDKKNSVLFTNIGYFLLSPNFKLTDESQVLLKVPRKNNMYSVDMKNIVPKESLTCLVAKATLDESMLWHRRLGHINFKNINKLVKDNLARGLPSKRFKNDQTCVACLKGKQHKSSCKSKIQNFISQPLFMLHMDLFGPTFVSSLMNKKYCLVVTDDYSRFTWVFFLASKDETSDILKSFITQIENLVDKKVIIIRCDNGTEFKNRVMSEFCEKKSIKREFSVARTPQQNGVAERRNRTLVKAARTMVLVVKPRNKTPYELFRGRTHALSFMRPFGCHVTILNTLDYLGKFDGKSDDGLFVEHSLNSKAFRVYNIRTRKVEENLHVRFLEDKPIIAGARPKWLFNIDVLTESMNYMPVVAETNSNIYADGSLFDSSSKNASNDEPQPSNDTRKKNDDSEIDNQERPEKSAQDVNTVGNDSEIYSEDSRMYWKIIRVGNHTEIRVELKRLFEPDVDDELWKSQKHIHDITWRLYDTCGVHHVSTKDGVDIYMLVEREYPLSRGSQIPDKSRKGVGFVSYNVVSPPHTRLFSPPKLDLSNSGLEEFQQPEFEGYGPRTSKIVSEDIPHEVSESFDAPLVEELVSNDKLEKKTVFPTIAKI